VSVGNERVSTISEFRCDAASSAFVNVAALELGQDVLWIHSARLDEALVTAAILPVCA
jgi:hypothetical protein